MKLILILCASVGLLLKTSAAELRGGWLMLTNAYYSGGGTIEMNLEIGRATNCGLNNIFIWTTSKYLENVFSSNRWDYWITSSNLMQAAGLTTHLWYSPWKDKETAYAPEIRDNPTWAQVSNTGVTNSSMICFARPEVRAYEVAFILSLIDRYTNIAGVHLEEPGLSDPNTFCYCDYCTSSLATNGVNRTNWYSQSCDTFVSDLRTALNARGRGIKLSANAASGVSIGYDHKVGRNWGYWSTNNWIDFYMPQIYTTNAGSFSSGCASTKTYLGGACKLTPGIAVALGTSWTNTATMIQTQINLQRTAGGSGFVLFRLNDVELDMEPKIRAATGTLNANRLNVQTIQFR